MIGIDIDEDKIQLAKNNSKVYGVQEEIDFRTGDYFEGNNSIKADVVYMSPPWGGPEYINRPLYSLATLCADHGGGKEIIKIALKIAPKIAMHLPRNLDKSEVSVMIKM